MYFFSYWISYIWGAFRSFLGLDSIRSNIPMLEACDCFVDSSFDVDTVNSFDDSAIELSIHVDDLSMVADIGATNWERVESDEYNGDARHVLGALSTDSFAINPASCLPMVGGSIGGVDVAGNPFGTDSNIHMPSSILGDCWSSTSNLGGSFSDL